MIEHALALLMVALFVATEALVFTIATFLGFKALLLERQSAFGRAIGRNNLAMSLAYYAAFFGVWIPFLRSPGVRFVIVVVTFTTALAAFREFSRVYGGWRAMLAEAAEALVELLADLRRAPLSMYRKMRALSERFWRRYWISRLSLVTLVVLVVLVVFVALAR